MSKECANCGGGCIGVSSVIYFFNQGCSLRVEAGDDECTECAKKRYTEKLVRAKAERIARIEDGKLLVNWGLFLDVYHNGKKYKRGYFDELINILMSLGFLTIRARRGYDIVDVSHRAGMNPRYLTGTYLYFTRLEDVMEYARLGFINTTYSWKIVFIGEVYGKEDLEGG